MNKADSYLIVKIKEVLYGLHVNSVLNILELQKITRIPNAPGYMVGVINLRGTVLPVIDTRVKLNLEPTIYNDNTCIVVMDLKLDNELIHVGALVDNVEAVYEIDDTNIQPSPQIGNIYNSDFITGVVKQNDSFIMILDTIKLFTGNELQVLTN